MSFGGGEEDGEKARARAWVNGRRRSKLRRR